MQALKIALSVSTYYSKILLFHILETIHIGALERNGTVGYTDGRNFYRVHVGLPPRIVSPSRYVKVTSGPLDVTRQIRSYAGPMDDLSRYTPAILGFDTLEFHLRNGESVTFSEMQPIVIPEF